MERRFHRMATRSGFLDCHAVLAKHLRPLFRRALKLQRASVGRACCAASAPLSASAAGSQVVGKRASMAISARSFSTASRSFGFSQAQRLFERVRVVELGGRHRLFDVDLAAPAARRRRAGTFRAARERRRRVRRPATRRRRRGRCARVRCASALARATIGGVRVSSGRRQQAEAAQRRRRSTIGRSPRRAGSPGSGRRSSATSRRRARAKCRPAGEQREDAERDMRAMAAHDARERDRAVVAPLRVPAGVAAEQDLQHRARSGSPS